MTDERLSEPSADSPMYEEGAGSMDEDELVQEASDDSFPASDPPSHNSNAVSPGDLGPLQGAGTEGTRAEEH